jgi:hypothetical protein
MTEFNNSTYEALVKDLVNDAFYIENRSPRGKIATVRQYSEIIIRKILNLKSEDFVTIGNERIRTMLKDQSRENEFLLNALDVIRTTGNDCTHTQKTEVVADDDVKAVIDSLFDMYSYLFIDFFEKYEFGSNMGILHAFSMLPPIIRYKTLAYLYEKHPDNIMLVDKLGLAILKAFDKETAIEWVEKRKENLAELPTVTPNAEKEIAEKYGEEVAKTIIAMSPKNMYDLCIDKINKVASLIDQRGKLYDDFESAIDFYKKIGIVEGDSLEVSEFNSIMEFLYLGRKSQKELNLA